MKQAWKRIKRALRLLIRPGFWVCIWAGESDDGRKSQRGRFAAKGQTRKEAEADALDYIKRAAWFQGDVYFRVRRPFPWEINL